MLKCGREEEPGFRKIEVALETCPSDFYGLSHQQTCRVWLRTLHREAMKQRSAALGFRSLTQYISSLIRFDLLLGGPHDEFADDQKFTVAEINALDERPSLPSTRTSRRSVHGRLHRQGSSREGDDARGARRRVGKGFREPLRESGGNSPESAEAATSERSSRRSLSIVEENHSAGLAEVNFAM